MHKHERTVFVVYYISPNRPVSIVGVYDDPQEAREKQAEQPEQFGVHMAPYYPTPPTEP